MEKFCFWDIEIDCPIEKNFMGTVSQAKEKAAYLAGKYHTTVCVYGGDNYKRMVIVNASGNIIYI